MAETNPQKHLYDLLKGFSTAMLATKGSDGVYHARPMGLAQLKPDAEAYFATDKRSGKVAEIEADPNVLVSFQSSSDYASICGVASIVEDRATAVVGGLEGMVSRRKVRSKSRLDTR